MSHYPNYYGGSSMTQKSSFSSNHRGLRYQKQGSYALPVIISIRDHAAFISHAPLFRQVCGPSVCRTVRRSRLIVYAEYDSKKSNGKASTTIGSSNEVNRKVFSPGEWIPTGEKYPPGKLPLAVELNFVLNHPVTESIITILVIVNCFAFALQTIDVGPLLHQAFRGYENNVSILFLTEYLARWYAKGLSPRFLWTRRMIIDFLAVAPIGFAVADQSEALFVRLLRLTRIFRLERMVMDSEGKDGMMKGMTNVQFQLASIGLSLFSLLYVSAGLFYQAEKDINPEVRTFFDAFYYSTITLFTVGFGDVTPLTSWGRIITVLTVLTGAVLIPFKLSEVDRVRKLVRAKGTEKAMVRETRAQTASEFETPMFSTRIEVSGFNNLSEANLKSESPDICLLDAVAVFTRFQKCSHCHLMGHQVDARFCRNCGNLLSKRMFDN